MNFPIPEKWKSKRQIIVETYILKRTVHATVVALNYASPSFVRMVVKEYREYLKNNPSPVKEAAEKDIEARKDYVLA